MFYNFSSTSPKDDLKHVSTQPIIAQILFKGGPVSRTLNSNIKDLISTLIQGLDSSVNRTSEGLDLLKKLLEMCAELFRLSICRSVEEFYHGRMLTSLDDFLNFIVEKISPLKCPLSRLKLLVTDLAPHWLLLLLTDKLLKIMFPQVNKANNNNTISLTRVVSS